MYLWWNKYYSPHEISKRMKRRAYKCQNNDNSTRLDKIPVLLIHNKGNKKNVLFNESTSLKCMRLYQSEKCFDHNRKYIHNFISSLPNNYFERYAIQTTNVKETNLKVGEKIIISTPYEARVIMEFIEKIISRITVPMDDWYQVS